MKTAPFFLTLLLSAISTLAAPFPETWAYLMKGEEKQFPAQSPITDIACFSANVDPDGYLQGGHEIPPRLPGAAPTVRYHLVVTMPWNNTLAHIYLDPALPFRQRMIDSIVKRAVPFDGLQIDFESVAAADGTAYLNFLAAVKKALPRGKLFSVAVLPRWQAHKDKNPNDAFDYPFIARIADRVVVMAYDEHFRSGPAGPIASLPWCRDIYRYAVATIAPEKLIMGIPLYGRSWQRETIAKAYTNREVVAELLKKGIKSEWNPENGGSFSFTETVTLDVYYETSQSLNEKMKLYAQHPIKGVAFWRISQEPDGFWQSITR